MAPCCLELRPNRGGRDPFHPPTTMQAADAEEEDAEEEEEEEDEEGQLEWDPASQEDNYYRNECLDCKILWR